MNDESREPEKAQQKINSANNKIEQIGLLYPISSEKNPREFTLLSDNIEQTHEFKKLQTM